MKLTRLADSRISRQQLFDVDLSLTDNGAGTTNTLNGFIDYSLGYHYRFEPINNLTLLAGASARLMAGFIYSTKASNNPASVKADFDLNVSAMVLYHLSIRNYPMTLRYQVETPFIGMLFSPHFGQSYYEIFDQGNSSGIVPFTSFHNKQALFVCRFSCWENDGSDWILEQSLLPKRKRHTESYHLSLFYGWNRKRICRVRR